MNLRKQEKMLRWLCLGSLSLIGSSCVTVPNTTACSVAGLLTAGAICAETQTGKTFDITLPELIDLLEPQTERTDPKHPGQILPPRGGAIIQSAEDYNKIKTALEQACRELGSRCSLEVRQAIVNSSINLTHSSR